MGAAPQTAGPGEISAGRPAVPESPLQAPEEETARKSSVQPPEEKTTRQSGSHGVQTAARDIRLTREGPAGEGAADLPAWESAPHTSYTPLELSLRTEGETEEAGAPASGSSPRGKEASRQPESRGSAPTGRPAVPESPVQVLEERADRRPGPRKVGTTARDIRVSSGAVRMDRPGEPLRPLASAEMTLNQPEAAKPDPHAPGTVKAADARGGTVLNSPAAPMEPLSLTYGPAQGTAQPQQPQEEPEEESDYVRSLPDWARRFLKTSRSAPAAQNMGVARDISSLPAPQTEEIEWTAPGYQLPQAPMAYREKKQERPAAPAPETHISDAEIQRTADKVYRMIEDRLRLERQRLGL